MKSKFISAKIVPTDLLRFPGFKYEVNGSYWTDSWVILGSDEVVTFDFQVMELEDRVFSNKSSYVTDVIHYGYRWLPHTTNIFVKEYEGLTPILFRRNR